MFSKRIIFLLTLLALVFSTSLSFAVSSVPDVYNLRYDYSDEDYRRYYESRSGGVRFKTHDRSDVSRLFEEKKIHIHFNGYTFHFTNDDDDINSFLYGAGLTWDIYQYKNNDSIFNGTMFSLDLDAANDSLGQFAYMVGISVRKKVFSWLAVGVNAGIINKQNVKADTGWPVFPYGFPFLQTTFDFPLNLRFMWIPPVRKSTDNQMMVQLLYSF